MGNNTKTITSKVPAFNSKSISNIAYVLAIVLFLMPFLNFKCNNTSLAKISGKDLVTGFLLEKKVKKNALFNIFEEGKSALENTGDKSAEDKRNGDATGLESPSDKKSEDLKSFEKPNVLVIISLLALVTACTISFFKTPKGGLLSAIAGTVSFVLLFFQFLRVQLQINEMSGADGLFTSIEVSFTFWFYLCLILIMLAIYMSYKAFREEQFCQSRPGSGSFTQSKDFLAVPGSVSRDVSSSENNESTVS